jgi:hypothetical protein
MVKHMQLTKFMTITKKTLLVALGVVFIFGMLLKSAFGASVVDYDISTFQQPIADTFTNSNYRYYVFYGVRSDWQSDYSFFTGNLTSLKLKLKSSNASLFQAQLQIKHWCNGSYDGCADIVKTSNLLPVADGGFDNYADYDFNFGETYNLGDLVSPVFILFITGFNANASGHDYEDIYLLHYADLANFTMAGTTANAPKTTTPAWYYEGFLNCYGGSGCNSVGSPYFIFNPVINPDISAFNLVIASDNTATITGTLSNYAGYIGVYVSIFDTQTMALVDANNVFCAHITGAFNCHLNALPAGEYTIKFTAVKAQQPLEFVDCATTFNFVLANPIPPSVTNPDDTQTPAGEYTAPVNPEQYRLLNSDWTTGTALYTTITNAIYPVVNAIGQWSYSFNGRFLTYDAINDGQAIGNGIATISAYASNLNGFFGNLPIVQALFVFLIFNLALAVLASIRFIIKLIK